MAKLETLYTLKHNAQAHAIYIHAILGPNQEGYSLKSISCDLLLHLNCSTRAPARRVFYGAVKLGLLYGSNSMNHYCFFPLDID